MYWNRLLSSVLLLMFKVWATALLDLKNLYLNMVIFPLMITLCTLYYLYCLQPSHLFRWVTIYQIKQWILSLSKFEMKQLTALTPYLINLCLVCCVLYVAFCVPLFRSDLIPNQHTISIPIVPNIFWNLSRGSTHKLSF